MWLLLQQGGQTNFAPIIGEMNKIIKEQRNKLMILTDGIIDVFDEIIDELV